MGLGLVGGLPILTFSTLKMFEALSPRLELIGKTEISEAQRRPVRVDLQATGWKGRVQHKS